MGPGHLLLTPSTEIETFRLDSLPPRICRWLRAPQRVYRPRPGFIGRARCFQDIWLDNFPRTGVDLRPQSRSAHVSEMPSLNLTLADRATMMLHDHIAIYLS